MNLLDPIGDDRLLRFVIEATGVRGALVQLGESWRSIAGREPYPPAIRGLLGQSLAAAALFGGHGKIDGRLSVQIKGSGPLRTLFAEFASRGTVRGIALWQTPVPEDLPPRDFGAGAMLAITIESLPPGADEPTRYQGMVGLDADRLDKAFESYFVQSEQLPTRLLLGCRDAGAAGLLIQQLPGESRDPDGWTRAQALFDTLSTDELLGADAEQLLLRLFHEDGVRLLDARPLAFACSCTRERVAGVLLQLGREEAAQAADSQPDGVAEVVCEMCGQRYRFDRVDLEQLFSGGGSAPTAGTH